MSTSASDDWVSCAPGELRRLSERLRGRLQRRVFLHAAVWTASGAAVAGIGLAWYGLGERGAEPPDPGTSSEPGCAGISCRHVQVLAPAYAADNLPPELRTQICRHLAECPECKALFKEMGLR